jgi:beta-lactamase regulating signal transducer with metallopeptidase domain
MNAIHLLTGPLSQSIGWALLHLLWQATIVAGILAAVLALVPRQAATTRYAAACAALTLVFVMFIGTAVRSYDPGARPIAAVAQQDPAQASQTIPITLSDIPKLIAATATASWREQALNAVATARRSLPSIVALWLAGVVLLSSRLLLSFLHARRLARRGTSEAGVQWQRAAKRISDALGLRRAVRLLESAAVEVPSVLGALRPVILLPASTLTGLTPDQIEMVLAHELAHIRRHDFLINLLQAFVETLMFYHPAVWWMSRSVRIERENCCDDLAVAVCGNPIQYARALTRLEELRGGALPVVVAANGGSLLDRIRRIATGRAESTSASARWAAAVVMFVVLGIAIAVPSLPALAQRDDPPAKAVKAKPATGHVDVVESARPESVEVDEVNVVIEPDGVEPPDIDPEPPVVDIEMPDFDIAMPAMTPPPAMPAYPSIPVYPAIAPMAMTPPTPAPPPGVAPMALPVLAPTPRPGPTPRAPRAPMAMAAMLAGSVDFDSDNDTDEPDKDFGASGKLTVDELIQLRDIGVTPEYIGQMRSLFPDLSLRSIVQMRAVGVTPDYIKEMRDAGFEMKTGHDAQNLRAVGVTGEWLQAMRAAGVDIKTTHDASTLRAVGVSPKLVQQLTAAGYSNLSVRELSRLAAAGIDGDFIREMEKYRTKK